MAIYVAYVPTTTIARAMFNFDAFGSPNYKLSGAVRVSVSDTFDYADYINPSYSDFYSGLYTSILTSNEVTWTAQMLLNIEDVFAIYSNFANISFQIAGDFDIGLDLTPNPEDVGRANVSDINITWIYRPDVGFAGVSGGYSDGPLSYTGAAGDVFLNAYASKFAGDYSLDVNTRARQTLMHEIGHSLGLSHPHSSYSLVYGPTITADYAATKDLGFDQLGFRTGSVADMHKEYFTIMSYDDQHSLLPGSSAVFHAHTPMILDVIALHAAYGEGVGTHGAGDDVIVAGTAGYRTYFDVGGQDTIDLSAYSFFGGAYLHMGVSIVGAPHLVGVGMSVYDAQNTIVFAGDPAHLRWFYGEYENALGSSVGDLIIGNALDNAIHGQAGDDVIADLGGSDVIVGGSGNDELQGGLGNDTYQFAFGHGQDTVYDLDATPGNQDTITFDAGIAPADIGAYRSGSDLVLARRGSYDLDRITLQQFDLGVSYQIEQVTFTGDATVWNAAYLLSHLEQAGSVLAAANAARIGQATAVSGMFQVVDPDGGSPYSYELWDGGFGGGYFRVGGMQQAAGVAIPVTAAQFATTDYFGGPSVGSETVYVRAYDGLLWTGWASWTMFTHNSPGNAAPVVSAADRNIDLNQWRLITELVSVTDADGPGLNQLQVRDTTNSANSGLLWADGVQYGQGATVTVSSLANTWVRGGAAAGADTYEVRAFDGVAWGAWTPFTMTTRSVANRAPAVTPTAASQTVATGTPVGAGTLFGISDADGDTPMSYEFWDGGAGGGRFRVNGVDQGAGVTIPVAAAQFATTQYVGGAASGSETVWVRAYDGQAWSAWAGWTMQTVRATNNAPVVSAADRNIDLNQWRVLSELASPSDADGDAIVGYEIRDLTATANSGYVWANGVAVPQGGTAGFTSLGSAWVRGGGIAGADNYEIRALDSENGWSAWTPFTMTTRTLANRAPVAAALNGAVQVGQTVALGALFSVSDADSDAPFAFELWDGGAGGGRFRVNGVDQGAGVTIPVSAAQLATTQYVAGAAPGSETLWVRATDGQAWSAWAGWTMFTHNSPGNAAPVVSAADRNIDLNQWRLITELVSVTDADGPGLNQLQVRDTTNSANSGLLWADGVQYGQGATVTVSSLANTWVRGGAAAGADTYEVRAFDGVAWGAWTPFTMTTRSVANRAPVVTPSAPMQNVGINTPVAVSTLFGLADADGDAPFAFELWDGGAGGGRFQVNGVDQAANQTIALSPAQLATTTYVGGASPGSETLWARTNDGQAWSGWVAWNMNTA